MKAIGVRYDGVMFWKTTRDLIDNVTSSPSWNNEASKRVRALIKKNRENLNKNHE